jgi:rhodanese-related sulfurtransferase
MLLMGFFGCSDDETTAPTPEPVNEFNVLIEYLEGAGGNYINTSAPKIVSAQSVASNLADYKIIDVRGANDYATSHITGAVNVPVGDVVTYCEANYNPTDKILVACYTGQSAGLSVMALNVLGWDAYSLKWGMSSADTSLNRWTSNIGSAYTGDFTTTATARNAAGDYPTLNTGKESGPEILRDRVDAVLAAGFGAMRKTSTDVMQDPSQFYIVNYFSETDYSGNGNCPPGHIIGATQYTPSSSLNTSEFLNTLPTDQQIVVYCWTGQNSSQVAGWLRVLGYDAYTLASGVNGMVYDQLPDFGGRWDQDEIYGLPLGP